MSIGKLIAELIVAAMILQAGGKLVSATKFMMIKAIEAQQTEMISLGAWNRALHGERPTSGHRHQRNTHEE